MQTFCFCTIVDFDLGVKSTLNGLRGWFVQSAPVDSGFTADPTSMARDNIMIMTRGRSGGPLSGQ